MTKPPSSCVSDVSYRSVGVLVLLMVVTLGLYWFYLAYQWSKELNGLAGRVKYQPLVVVLVSFFTCTLGGLVYECVFAFDVVEGTASRGIAGRMVSLPTWVILLNCVALALGIIPYGIILGYPLGMAVTALVQVELNKLAWDAAKLA